MRGAVIVCVAALAAACGGKKAAGPIDSAPVRVVDVVKGDEIVVEHGDKKHHVRMLGIYAFSPDNAGPTSPAVSETSKGFLREILVGKDVTLQLGKNPQDPHGRYLAYVSHAGADINRRMLEEGHAIVYTEFPVDREAEYLRAEKSARDAKRNIWQHEALIKLVAGLRKQWLGARAGTPDQPADEMLALP